MRVLHTKKRVISSACLAGISLLMLSACQSQSGAGFAAASSSPSAYSADGLNTQVAAEGELLAALNSERSQAGLKSLSYNGQLTRAARAHAADLIKSGTFSHTGSNGSTVSQRAKAAGYTYCLISENLSVGLPTAQGATQAWMQSPGHRKNILMRDVTEIGIAIGTSERGPLYVTVFGKPC